MLPLSLLSQVTDSSTSSRARALTPLSKVCKRKVSKPKWLKWVFQFNVERPLYVCCMDIHNLYYTLFSFTLYRCQTVLYMSFFLTPYNVVSLLYTCVCVQARSVNWPLYFSAAQSYFRQSFSIRQPPNFLGRNPCLINSVVFLPATFTMTNISVPESQQLISEKV